MTIPPREELLPQAPPIAAMRRAVMTASDGFLSELMIEDPQEEWQVRLRSLQEWICELLIKNQQLRIALMETKARVEG